MLAAFCGYHHRIDIGVLQDFPMVGRNFGSGETGIFDQLGKVSGFVFDEIAGGNTFFNLSMGFSIAFLSFGKSQLIYEYVSHRDNARPGYLWMRRMEIFSEPRGGFADNLKVVYHPDLNQFAFFKSFASLCGIFFDPGNGI